MICVVRNMATVRMVYRKTVAVLEPWSCIGTTSMGGVISIMEVVGDSSGAMSLGLLGNVVVKPIMKRCLL